jgi:hypothetical protein
MPAPTAAGGLISRRALPRSVSSVYTPRPSFGSFSPRCTELEVVIHGTLKGLAKFRDGFTLKSDDIAEVNNFPVKDVGIVIKLYVSDISFVFHHFIEVPMLLKN